MITGKDELLQAMIEVFIMEKGTNEFYTKASIKAIDSEARRAFGELARWEEEHMQYIQSLYQSIREEKEMLSFESFKSKIKPETVEGGVLKDYLEKEIESPLFLDDLGALTIALEIEAKAYIHYKKLSETAEDTSTREFMKDMMKREQSHIDYLKKLRYKIAETS
ncbi:MAG: ferritin family protein [Nitrospirae bacterium]|nr:ferritin family protein [Nitrospirota bacterium]